MYIDLILSHKKQIPSQNQIFRLDCSLNFQPYN